jgi:ABC-type sugar transport system substrate-binding protein
MKKGLCLVFMTALVFAFAANVNAGGSSAAQSGEIRIGISMDAIESQFWAANQAAMKKALDAQGVKYVEVIAEGDAQKQNQQIDTLISQGVKAIIIAPKDGTTIVSAAKKCNAAGIPVIMDNRPAAEGAVINCTVVSDNKAMAAREMEWIAQKAKAAGKKYTLLEFIGNLTDVNAVYRHEGVTEVVKKYPDVFVKVIEIPTEWKAENADSLGQAALQANPDINMIFTASDMLIPTVKSMLQKFNRWYPVSDSQHVTWATFDGAADAVNEIKAGYIDIVSVQDSPLQGELCVKNAIALAKGEKVDAVVYDPGFEVTTENWQEKGFSGF